MFDPVKEATFHHAAGWLLEVFELHIDNKIRWKTEEKIKN
jgi:hypothetical protein